ncbi:hypothetical protein OROGR_023843 [Orobanche gracilis]
MFNSIWKADAPHKSCTTAWRPTKDRLPTCENLFRRRIIHCRDKVGCLCEAGEIESVKPLVSTLQLSEGGVGRDS